MFYVLSKILDVLLGPLAWGMMLLAYAVPWTRRGMRWSRRKRAAGAVGLVLLWVSSTSPVANRLGASLERSRPPTFDAKAKYDVVVMLGGVLDERVSDDVGQVSYNDNVERVVMTEKLLREGHARYAIVSSGALDPAHPERGEAQVVSRQLVEWGIDPSRILLEERARNTHENAVYTKEIVAAHGFTKVLIVTSAFHMPRSIECFRAVGMDVDTLSVDYRAYTDGVTFGGLLPRSHQLDVTTSMVRELFGRLIYRVQGYGKGA